MFFVYLDWTLEKQPRVFYVGRGLEARIKLLKRNKHHTAISKAYGFRREIVLQTSLEDVTKTHEIELIDQHKTYVYGGEDHWGANYTLGGEGCRGRVVSAEERRKKSLKHKGMKHTPETIAKISASRKGKGFHDAADRQKISARAIEAINRPDVRKRIIDGLRVARERNPERYKDPALRQKLSEAVRASWKRRKLQNEHPGKKI